MKFYQTTNTARTIPAAGKQISFEATEYVSATNSTWGVYATDDLAEIADLDTAVAAGKIYSLTEAEYVTSQKKKVSLGVSPSLIGLKNWHSPQIGAQRTPDAQPAVVVAEPELLDEVLAPKAPIKASRPSKK